MKPKQGQKTILLLLCGTMAVALANASQVEARIDIGQSIAGIKIGDSMKDVRKTLGKPRKVVPPNWKYGPPLRGSVGFDRRKVNDIWTSAKSQRTRKGIGPGSSLRATKRAYRDLRCYEKAGKWRILCKVVSPPRRRGKVHTAFLFRKRLVVVDVFLVPFGTRAEPS